MAKQFVYIGDPMCSWCWGFAPVLDKLLEAYPLALRTIVGGLRPGKAAQPLDDTLRSYLKNHWQQVEATSGQTFNYKSLDRENWIYDTEPAARAVVAMRQLAPEQEYPFFKLLQKAFYNDAVDITQPEVYPDLLDRFEVDADTFLGQMISSEIKEATYHDFALTQHLGIRGFPSLLLADGDELTMLSHGYKPFEQLSELVGGQLR